jgi:hypothetical protein
LTTATLLRIPARTLLTFTTTQLWENLAEGEFILVMDDGEFLTNEKETIYSSYAWDYHRAYPESPLLMRHHVKSIIKEGRSGAGTHLELINNARLSAYDTYKYQCPDRTALLDVLSRMSYEITNTMYNDLTYRLEAYVTSLDILDFLQISTHPRIKEAFRVMAPTEKGIAQINQAIVQLISEDAELPGNALVKTIRSGLARPAQALNCLAARGFLTDIDSHLFKIPIKRGFIQGLRSLYDSMVESRTAAISLINSTEPLQQSEYFSRRQQLICQNVRNLHLGDCGSTEYLIWKVRDTRYSESGAKTADSDLKNIAGKYYLDEDSNTLQIVKESDTHLLGKTLKLRSVVAGCAHPDPYGICEICFGQASEAVPANSNIGHITCVAMTSSLGQNILSTKHFIGSSVVEGITLDQHAKKYFTAAINGNAYYLNEALKKKQIRLVVPADQALGLADLSAVDDVSSLNLSRISEFDEIYLFVEDEKGSVPVPLTVQVNKRKASMTHRLLKHIKESGWVVTAQNNYEIDMAGWDYTQPILVLPMRHFNMSDHQQEIASILEATVDELETRSETVHPGSMLIEFYDLVNHRLNINLAVLEVILYSSMVVSATKGDYSLPKPWTESGVGVMRKLLECRSMSATMGYQGHLVAFTSASSFCNKNRMDHIMDAVLMPHEVLSQPTV